MLWLYLTVWRKRRSCRKLKLVGGGARSGGGDGRVKGWGCVGQKKWGMYKDGGVGGGWGGSRGLCGSKEWSIFQGFGKVEVWISAQRGGELTARRKKKLLSV